MNRLWLAGFAAILLVTGPARWAAAQDKQTQEIIRKGIEAAGGQKALESLKAAQSKSKGTIHYPAPIGDVTFAAEEFLVLPDKMRSNVQAEAGTQKSKVIIVFDGQKGWVQENGKTKPLDDKGVAEMKATAYASRVGSLTELLKDKAFSLSPLAETKVAGKPAVGVLVKHAGQRDIRLYFDKSSGLLVKSESPALDVMTKKEVPQEKIFSDYKSVSGRQVPHKVLILQNGKPYMEVEVTEVRIVDRLDPMLFAEPK
jgi:outer membrane lipoprotein-sorting protein